MAKVKVFDLARYTQAQIVDALTCPINRHCTRVEYGCDDWELHKHPDWLLTHYIKHGGAREFANRRKEFEREVTIPDEDYQI